MKRTIILAFIFVMVMSVKVWGYSGNGKKDDPFVVSSGNELKSALTEYSSRTSWIYIAVDDTIAITDTIDVDEGKYRIYAIKGNRTIRRSANLDAKVNDKDSPRYCMRINNKATVVLGYNGTDYKLTIDGKRSIFTGNRRCSGWVKVGSGATLTIGKNGHFKDAMNNKEDSECAPIVVYGILNVNGEISNCKGKNGGAIKSIGGLVTVNEGSSIHNCDATSEGGGIYSKNGGNVVVEGGKIYSCTSKEEGGGIFAVGDLDCDIKSGDIYNNSSEKSGGGVFAGYGATLTLGTTSGSKPNIYSNRAGGSGGGVRCNGGTDSEAGGSTIIYSANIHDNTSGKYGGGIACGSAGANGYSNISIKNSIIDNNVSEQDGGGIRLPENAEGFGSTNGVTISNCKIRGNTTKERGGGIMVLSKCQLKDTEISGNNSTRSGGGIFIGQQSICIVGSGTIRNNTSDKYGAGVYVNGYFRIKSDITINVNNNVYLPEGKFIEVVGKLSQTSGYIAQIDSEKKDNGTILVKAGYADGTGSEELYYSGNLQDEYNGIKTVQRYKYYNLADNRCLRPTDKVNGYEGVYIILSEKYNVSYDSNTTDQVTNLPNNQVKFWHEDISLSSNTIERNGYAVNEDKHWNTDKNGKGTTIKPGGKYSIDGNKKLYAQWLTWWVDGPNRYYIVGQNIILNNDEILKKVKIINKNNAANYFYQVKCIINSHTENTEKGDSLRTHEFMDTTNANEYEILFETRNDINNIVIKNKMKVYVLDVIISKGITRFISYDFLNTLDSDSKWNISLKSQLKSSLEKKKTEGIYHINLNNSKILEIKNKVKSNNYKISNAMNRNLMVDLFAPK